MKELLIGAALAVVVVAVVGLVWGQCDYASVAKTALADDPRFAGVTVAVTLRDVIALSGKVRTERDKWDARDAIWKRWPTRGCPRPSGVLNYVWSEEFRDSQTSRPMKMLPCKDTGYQPPCSMSDP